MEKKLNQKLILALLVSIPSIALAHTGFLTQQSFMHGFTHPLSGWDHMLAMFAVGLIASQQSKRTQFWLPVAFITFMVLGGLIGMLHLYLPWIELGITLSVFFFGAFLWLPISIPIKLLTLFTALFAICHGHAHGNEMLMGSNALLYGMGFVAATALLHAIGMLLGWTMARFAKWVLPISGATLSLAAIWI